MTDPRLNPADADAPYSVYKADMSYFSGKFEAYLRYKGIPHQPINVTREIMQMIARNTGTMKIPAVRTVQGEWLFDTTEMMAWFEQRYPAVPAIPDDPALAFLAALLEDYGDEWLWRPSMWWRWEPLVSRRALGLRIGLQSELPLPLAKLAGRFFARRRRREWLWNDGVNRENVNRVRDLYLQELEFLQAQLEQQPYLLGSHPSIADFGYFGPMFRHFGNDPDPAEVMRRKAPAAYEWLARLWNASSQKLAQPIAWVWPQGSHWGPLLQRLSGDYLPYLHQNAVAYRDGKKRFDFSGKSIEFPQTITTHFRVWCREELQRKYRALPEEAHQQLDGLFAPYGGLQSLETDGVIESGLKEKLHLPVTSPPSRSGSFMKSLLGQPRN